MTPNPPSHRYSVAVLLQAALVQLAQNSKWESTFQERDVTTRPAVTFHGDRLHVWYPDGSAGAESRLCDLFGRPPRPIQAVYTFSPGGRSYRELLKRAFRIGNHTLTFHASPPGVWADITVELRLSSGPSDNQVVPTAPLPDCCSNLFVVPLFYELDWPAEDATLQVLLADLPPLNRALVLPPRRLDPLTAPAGQVAAYGRDACELRNAVARLLGHPGSAPTSTQATDDTAGESSLLAPAALDVLRLCSHPFIRDAVSEGGQIEVSNGLSGRRLALALPANGSTSETHSTHSALRAALPVTARYRRDFLDPRHSLGSEWQDSARRSWFRSLTDVLHPDVPVRMVQGDRRSDLFRVDVDGFGDGAAARAAAVQQSVAVAAAVGMIGRAAETRSNELLRGVARLVIDEEERYRQAWLTRSPATARFIERAQLSEALARTLSGWCGQPEDAADGDQTGPAIGLTAFVFWPLFGSGPVHPALFGLPQTYEAFWSALTHSATADREAVVSTFLTQCGLFSSRPGREPNWIVRDRAVYLPLSPTGLRVASLLHLLLPLRWQIAFGFYLARTRESRRPPVAIGPQVQGFGVPLPQNG